MRKPHTRWMALAGAATVSLAAFGAAGPVSAEDRLPLALPVIQQKAPTYLVDGFEVDYLAPGLERHSMNSEAFTDRTGDRTAHLAWVQGPKAVHGKVSVYRIKRLDHLDEVRDSRYSHLNARNLKRVDVNGKEGYLSEATGDVFWLERDEVAVAVFLRPDKWETEELMAMAEGISPREESAPDVPDINLPPLGVPNVRGVAGGEEAAGAVRPASARLGEAAGAGGTEEAGTDAPETLPAPAPEQEEGDGRLSDEETAAVKRCLTEEIGTMPGAIWDQNIEFFPGSSVTWNSGLWNELQEPIRKAAVTECADQLGLEESQVEEVLKEMSHSPRPAEEGQELPSFSQGQDLWNFLAWQ